MTSATPDPAIPQVPAGSPLATQTSAFAADVSKAVADQYLEFRRKYFHDNNPSLATLPPHVGHVHQTEGAKIAAEALRFMPREAFVIPVIRDLLNQLQWEVDIHTLTERELIALHNLTMAYLYGIQGGVQPWFVNWQLAFAHALQKVNHPDYYLAFPWHGLMYRTPAELQAFDAAVRAGDAQGIQREVKVLHDRLLVVLRDPLGTQEELAFTGPESERRRLMFTIKTRAALALGAYLAIETVRGLLRGEHKQTPPESVMASVPPELAQHVLPEEAPPAHQ